MKRRLTQAEVEYVWMHFEHHYAIGSETKKRFKYIGDLSEIRSSGESADQPIVYFLCSDQEVSSHPFFDDQNNLVLYPCTSEKIPYKILDNKLIFFHDYLKSIFYFISGYQEWQSGDMDQFGRFEYKVSLQSRYNLPPKPFVNEWIQLLGDGLTQFCKKYNLFLEQRQLFDHGVFLLSHDIDHIQQYRLSYFKYKLKEIFGVVKNTKYTKPQLIGHFGQGILNLATGLQDPAWSFDFIHNVNQENEVKSTYFFLDKEGKRDASFDLHSKSVRSLILKIDQWGDEIGVHGTMASSVNKDSATKILNDVEAVSPQPINGIRQHWLIYKFPETTRIHQSLGYRYDATLGFNDRAGFRHGYCFPFKLWDFDKNKPFDVWEIPLCVMDVTLLSYMNLSIEECEDEIQFWLDEVRNWGGVFSLLWHNSTLNEYELPGVRQKYRKLIKLIASKLDTKTHGEVMDKMENTTRNG